MEREKFEESLKRAFDQAGISPSEKVWTNIELDLEKAKGGELKRRLLFYQMLAAASVVFAMAIGGVGYYYSFEAERGRADSFAQNSARGQDQMTEALPSQPDVSTESREADIAEKEPVPAIAGLSRSESAKPIDNTGTPAAEENSRTLATPGDNRHRSNAAMLAGNPADANTSGDQGTRADAAGDHPVLPLGIEDDRALPPLYAKRDIRLHFDRQEQEVDPVVAMLARLEQREREVRDEEKHKKSNDMKSESLWTSVGFSAGAFNTVRGPSASGSSPSFDAASLAAPIVDQESKATGYSYSMGVNLGTRISERWVLQGGVNYLTHSSEYTSNSLFVDGPGFMMADRYKPATTNAVVNANEYQLKSSIVYSAPYNVNNSMRYLSIPMQAGYLLVDRTFGVQLNAGVATDLFLRNTVKGEGDQLEEATQPGGADSPYRTVNLSGLVGTEFSYRFGPHYRVSLNPGIRYPFNTIYKSELGVESSPLTFDVGLRFRYIFR